MILSEIIDIVAFVGPILTSMLIFTESIGFSCFCMGVGIYNLITYLAI